MNKKFKIFLFLSIILILLAFLFFNLISSFFYGYSKLVSKSMFPTIQPLDTVKIEKFPSGIKRGDIVAYKHDKNQKNSICIHRVIAVGGDVINFQKVEKNNFKILINGKVIEENYLPQNTQYFTADMNIYKSSRIPQNYVYLLGDNRLNAYDSRFIGSIPISDIYGKVISITKPKNHKKTF